MGKKPPYDTVIYSLPDSKEFHSVRSRSVSAVPEGSSYFVVRPFTLGGKATYLPFEDAVIDELGAIEVDLPEFEGEVIINTSTYYESKVREAIGLSSEIGGKVVMSRVEEVGIEAIHLKNSLQALRLQYPHAFVYLLSSSEHGVWMGASPEILIEQHGDSFSSVALAGTKWNDDLFENKEFEEQMTVSRYILEKLEDAVVEVSDVYEHAFGPLRHLRTDFQWKDERDLLTFAERLHPTPAVCGYPRSEALKFLEGHEGYDRQLYTGYLGPVYANESAHLFVNLRCIQLFRDRLLVYVGGGINAMSEPAKEWEETERKKDSVLSALHYE